MARRYNLELELELEKTIRNFNAKISRLGKQGHALLPEKADWRQIKQEARTTKDIRNKISELKGFSKRGSEEIITTSAGVDITRYELEKLRRDSKAIKQRLTREINKLEKIVPTSLGVKQQLTLKELPTDRLINLRARRKSLNKDIFKLSGDEFSYYVQKIASNKRPSKYRDTNYQNNYTNKMLLDLGYLVGYDTRKLQYIQNQLSKMNTKDFLRLMDTEKIISDIQNFYGEVSDRRGRISSNTISDIYEKYDMLYENIDKIIDNYK